MLTAIMTNAAWTWSAVVTSSLCYALIFWFHTSLPSALGGEHEMHSQHGAHSASFSLHLQGMWLAYTIAAIAIALFVSRLSVALQRERERRLEGEKLLGLAALAAGAAHEIGNPLGTIRVVTSDLESLVKSEGRNSESVSAELLSDIKLINDEVERAKRVLDRLASSAGELRGEPILPMDASRFFEQLHGREEVDERVSLSLSAKLPPLTWPTEAVSQALIQLLRNARQASPADASVILSAHAHQDKIVIEIIDQGHGMSDATLARYGTPFFTTREGSGMGLGVFVAKSLVERLRGDLTVRSAVNEGTTVSVTLPLKMTDSISPQE
jgi:two-component system sensor histidine kinase RegB